MEAAAKSVHSDNNYNTSSQQQWQPQRQQSTPETVNMAHQNNLLNKVKGEKVMNKVAAKAKNDNLENYNNLRQQQEPVLSTNSSLTKSISSGNSELTPAATTGIEVDAFKDCDPKNASLFDNRTVLYSIKRQTRRTNQQQ